MSNNTNPPNSFWVIAILAILWNIMGLISFVGDMMITPEAIAALPEAQQQMYLTNPLWLKVVYSIATVGGLIGAVGLAMKKSWSVNLFLISMIAVIIQMGYSMLSSNIVEAMGKQAVILPIVVILLAIYFYFYASRAAKRGWIA